MNFEERENRITCLGETNFRHHRRRFGIKRADRRAHMYVIGKTGTGKSTMIANLIRQDIANGEGLARLISGGKLGRGVRCWCRIGEDATSCRPEDCAAG